VLTTTKAAQTGPTIALCVIAKNEADMIAECLDSARPFVNEIIVVDTGSTDGTVEIAREHGARVVHFEWVNDFAAARNAAIERAKCDWILMLDADERLTPESGPFLRQAAEGLPAGYYGFCMQIENRVQNRSMAHYMTRFFPRHPQVRFEGRIHEELKSKSAELGQLVMMLPMVRVIHLGYEPEIYAARRKDERNMRLLEAEIADDPDNARLLYYVMQQHCAQRRYAEALAFPERFMANKSQMRQAFEIEVSRMWVEALLALGRPDEAMHVFHAAERSGTVSSYSYEMVGNHELVHKRIGAALAMYERARNATLPLGLWARPTGEEWELATKVADCRWELGQHKRALSELERAMDLVPEDRRAVLALTAARKSMQVQQFAAACRWATRAHEQMADDLSQHLEVVDLEFAIPEGTTRQGAFAVLDRAVSAQDWQAVYDEALRLSVSSMAALARLIRVASRMSDEGAADAALDLLERAMDAYPEEPLVYWHLARALNAIARHEDAANALSVLGQLQASSRLAQAA
jgi:tetratricopeptide (TPR) repeat protein